VPVADQDAIKERLIQKLFDNTCSEEELSLLFRLIRKDPSPPDLQLMEKLWERKGTNLPMKQEVSDRIFSRVTSQINDKDRLDNHLDKKTTISGSGLTRRSLSIAAAILILISCIFWIWMSTPHRQVIQTAYGEWQTFDLSDGSKVRLNANSQMIFDSKWSDHDNREVWLRGEAYFEVQKKNRSRQKFQVKTSSLTVEVLGTAFNVNSHGDKTSVYLEEGEIRLYITEPDSIILMKPGDLVVYDKVSGQITNKHQVQTELYTSWKNGVLIFKDSPLKEVLLKIEEIYGVIFQVRDTSAYLLEVNFPLPIYHLETAISILDKTMVDYNIRREGEHYIVE
jgi:transmembrane sensor